MQEKLKVNKAIVDAKLLCLLSILLILISGSIKNAMSSEMENSSETTVSIKTSSFPPDHFNVTDSLLQDVCFICESVIGDVSNFLPVGFLEKGFEVQKAIARITNCEGKFGTGFMISPSILLTNNHVFSSPNCALGSKIEFNYQINPLNGSIGKVDLYAVDTTVFYTSDKNELDYTIVKLNGSAGSKWGYLPLPHSSVEQQISELEIFTGGGSKMVHANIIQHPGGDYKEIALQDNTLTTIDADKGYIRYTTDTENGASGAPVLDDGWNLIALHHSVGNETKVLLSPLDNKTDLLEVKTLYLDNEGILASAIVKDLLQNYKDDLEGMKILKELGIDLLTKLYSQ